MADPLDYDRRTDRTAATKTPKELVDAYGKDLISELEKILRWNARNAYNQLDKAALNQDSLKRRLDNFLAALNALRR